jgi:hypothetical protein
MVFPQSIYSPARVSNGALAAKESVPAPCMLLKMRCGGFSSPPFRTNSLGTTHNRPFPSCPILCPLGFFFADSGRRKCEEWRRCSLLEDPLNRVCLGLQEYGLVQFHVQPGCAYRYVLWDLFWLVVHHQSLLGSTEPTLSWNHLHSSRLGCPGSMREMVIFTN